MSYSLAGDGFGGVGYGASRVLLSSSCNDRHNFESFEHYWKLLKVRLSFILNIIINKRPVYLDVQQ